MKLYGVGSAGIDEMNILRADGAAKVHAPTPSIRPTPRRSGKRVKRWLEKPCSNLTYLRHKQEGRDCSRPLAFSTWRRLHVFYAVDEGLQLAAAAGVTEFAGSLRGLAPAPADARCG